jgi:hypothetical protein
MNTVLALSLLSGNIAEHVSIPAELAVICLWSAAGLLLTTLAYSLGFGGEIGQALAIVG